MKIKFKVGDIIIDKDGYVGNIVCNLFGDYVVKWHTIEYRANLYYQSLGDGLWELHKDIKD